ncbi:thioesterase family protein [Enterococcus sp. LJL99]
MISFSKKFIVTADKTAEKIGSGDLEVLATPAMIAMVENTAKEYLQKELAAAETSVGSFIEAKHLKPSPIGTEIVVEISVSSKEKAKIDFSFDVFENEQLVATGKHQRVVVLTELFLTKLGKSN